MTYYSHVAVVLNTLPNDLKKEEKKRKIKNKQTKKNQYEQEHRIIH